MTSSHDKTILFWELVKTPVANGPNYTYVPHTFLKVQAPTYFLDIILTGNRFICRKGKPNSTIKIIKFRNIKDLKAEMFSEEFYEHVTANHSKRKDNDSTQPVV